MVLVWKSSPSALALCGYSIVNTYVSVRFHFFRETCLFDDSGSLCGVVAALGVNFVFLEGPGNRLDF